MRFFDPEREKNDEFRGDYQKKDLPGIITYKSEINGRKNACDDGINDMAVVFSAFPNGIENQKGYQRNGNGIDKKHPPAIFHEPADDINKKSESPGSDKRNGGYNTAAESALRFCFFRRFPFVVGREKIIYGDTENFAHEF